MKSIQTILKEIRESGLIYDPFVTAAIISYESGRFLRDCFYASMVEEGRDDEEQLKAAWLADAKIELSDLITQCRVIAEIYGWDWSDLVNTGEDKLVERIETYKARGVRPNEALLRAFMKSQGMGGNSLPPITPSRSRVRRYDGD